MFTQKLTTSVLGTMELIQFEVHSLLKSFNLRSSTVDSHSQRVTVCCDNPIGQGLAPVLAQVVVVVIVVICEKSGGTLRG